MECSPPLPCKSEIALGKKWESVEFESVFIGEHRSITQIAILHCCVLRVLTGILRKGLHLVSCSLVANLLLLGSVSGLRAGLVVHVALELAGGLYDALLELIDTLLHTNEELFLGVQRLIADVQRATVCPYLLLQPGAKNKMYHGMAHTSCDHPLGVSDLRLNRGIPKNDLLAGAFELTFNKTDGAALSPTPRCT